MDGELILINTEPVQDETGVFRCGTETRTPVLCRVRSATRTEFHSGGREGLNPELVFTMFAGDYGGQMEVEYLGQRYAVIRTYRGQSIAVAKPTRLRRELSADDMELFAAKKGGAMYGEPNPD